MSSNFQLVVEMNEAFGNPAGERHAVSKSKLRKQCLNIADELGELYIALGADKTAIEAAVENLKWNAAKACGDIDLDKTRDALCDLHVFAYGAHHFMSIDANADMRAVVGGVMTRFMKNHDDEVATRALHAAKGVTDVYTEGQYPTAVLKSASDQKDAPAGKFLKSASYQDTRFRKENIVFVD